MTTNSPPQNPENIYNQIVSDARSLGLDFRINDLDDSTEVLFEGKWQQLNDVMLAVIETDLRELGYGKKKKGAIEPAIKALTKLAHRQRFNPVKDYFSSLEGRYKPDSGGAYIIPGFAKYFTNPDGMFGRWLFRWMVGSIAKAFQGERNPMLVLVGAQGIGKSWFIRYLCPINKEHHFIEASIRPDDKDYLLRLTDVLVWEVAELGATTKRADIESLKAFITQRWVRVRPAHARKTIEKPALCSFVGSVNNDGAGFLNDPTGNTRFLACQVDAINYDYAKINVDLLWSEAYWFYQNVPDSWKLTREEQAIQAQINSSYEMVNELEEVAGDAFEFTLNLEDFVTAQDAKNHLISFGYSPSGSSNAFFKELNRVMHKRGAIKARGAYKPGQPHQHGWRGVKKVGTQQLF